MQRSRSKSAIYGLMIFAGIILIIRGILYINITKEFMEDAIKTQATIIDINKYTRRYTDFEGDYITETTYAVNVEFYIKNEKINSTIYLDNWKIGMKENQKIDIYYNPSDLSEVRLTEVDKKGQIMIGTGIVLLLAGVILLAKV